MVKKKLTVSTKEAIKITGYTSQRLNQLVKEEVLSKEKHGDWNLQKLFRDVCNHKIKLAIDPFQKELQKYRAHDPEHRMKIIKADNAEYDLQIKQHKILHVESIRDFLKKIGSLIVKEFEPIGRECQARFKYLIDDVEKIEEIVRLKDKTLDAIANTNINSLLPDTFGNPTGDVIKNRKRTTAQHKTKTGSKNK